MIAILGPSLFIFLVVFCLTALWWFRVAPVPEASVNAVLGDKPLVIAHRGAALDAPENTIEAFQLAKKNGADAIEFDLEFTKDSCPVIIHDDTVDRTTDGKGPISRYSFEAIQKLDAAAKHKDGTQFGKVKVPSLEEAVVACLRLKLKMFIDCKRDAKLTAQCLSQLFTKYPDMYKETIVCSFYFNIIYKLRQIDPKIVTGLTFRHQFITKSLDQENSRWWHWLACIGDILLELAHHIFLWYLCGNSACLMNNLCYSSNSHTFWKNRGLHLVLWTVNDSREKDYLLHTKKCSIITDTIKNDKINRPDTSC